MNPAIEISRTGYVEKLNRDDFIDVNQHTLDKFWAYTIENMNPAKWWGLGEDVKELNFILRNNWLDTLVINRSYDHIESFIVRTSLRSYKVQLKLYTKYEHSPKYLESIATR